MPKTKKYVITDCDFNKEYFSGLIGKVCANKPSSTNPYFTPRVKEIIG